MISALARMFRGPKPAMLTYVVPNYGYEHLIGDCLASLLAQTRPDWRAIVVHQGPEEAIAPVLARHADPRITHLAFPGPVTTFKARRAGFEAVTTPFTAHIDADDMVGPRHAEHLLGAALRTGADIVIGNIETEHPDGSVVVGEKHTNWSAPMEGKGADAALFMRDHSRSIIWDAVYRTDALRDTYAEIPQDLAVSYAEDTVLRFMLWSRDVSFVRVPEIVYRYRRHADSVTQRGGLDAALRRWNEARTAYGFLHDTFRADDRRMSEMPWLLDKVARSYRNSVAAHVWTLSGLAGLPEEEFQALSRDVEFDFVREARSHRTEQGVRETLRKTRDRNAALRAKISRLEAEVARLRGDAAAPEAGRD
ncbi:glycosyltransferase family 2 protein [Histidinibacterium lentulum]|uniref:Glycosyltransferase n=1 Tax=Histidinibacterium lentulum TaxID=2480588 RepID=A0A3N2R183_9RHOB|nr:glycosyltransferase [Histidinibacterium lentulum]ROU01241.1 glycosyltransferase [Histidinibacterium lentulum]